MIVYGWGQLLGRCCPAGFEVFLQDGGALELRTASVEPGAMLTQLKAVVCSRQCDK